MSISIEPEVRRAVGKSVTRPNVQRAIQKVIESDRPNVRLFRQLVTLDLALEVEQTVLLDMDDKARNLNNPARLASTYKEMKQLLDDGEAEVNDGWADLLGEAITDPIAPALELIEGESKTTASSEPSPTGNGGGNETVSDVGDGEGGRLCLSKTLASVSTRGATPYPAELRRKVIAAILKGQRSLAAIARDNGVAINTVQRWRKMHITDGRPVL